MKKKIVVSISIVFIFLAAGSNAFSEMTFSGNAGISAMIILPEGGYSENRFEGALNPNNIMGLHDIMPGTDLNIKLSSEGETGALDMWLTIKPFNFPDWELFSSAEGTEPGLYAYAGMLESGNSGITGINIKRASISLYPADYLSVTIGRQDLFTGYGYAWNPMNFAGKRKDIFDPQAELAGTDSVTFSLNAGNIVSLNISGIYEAGGSGSGASGGGTSGSESSVGATSGTGTSAAGIDLHDMGAFAGFTFYFPSVEFSVDGIYYFSKAIESLLGSSSGSSSGTSSGSSGTSFYTGAGAGFMADIMGIGIYGEGAILNASRSSLLATSSKGNPVFNGLGGFQYTFPWETTLTFEYFYNGEGYDLSQRESYYQQIVTLLASGMTAPGSTEGYFLIPGYFSKHYLFLNILQPLYDINSEASLAAIYSPDSYNLMLMPLYRYNISDEISLELGYLGLFSLKDGQYNEAFLFPARHFVSAKVTYSF